MEKRKFISPAIWTLETGTADVLNQSYSYDDNGMENSGGETGAGDDFWD